MQNLQNRLQEQKALYIANCKAAQESLTDKAAKLKEIQTELQLRAQANFDVELEEAMTDDQIQQFMSENFMGDIEIDIKEVPQVPPGKSNRALTPFPAPKHSPTKRKDPPIEGLEEKEEKESKQKALRESKDANGDQ